MKLNIFLKKLEKWRHQEQINPNYSLQTIFGVFDDKKLVGGFILRHTLKSTLVNHGGSICCLVRPVKRKRRYEKILLKFALKKREA